MLLTPIIVGVMWRALLNPDWGIVNWVIAQLGLRPPNWLGSIEMAMSTLIMVDVWQWTPFVFLIVFARLQVAAAACLRGGPARRRRRACPFPPYHPCRSDAGHRLRRDLPGLDAFRSFDLIYGLSYGGPARSTTTLSFFSFQNGFQFQNYGYAAAVAYMMLLILIVGSTVLLRYVQLRPG